MARPKPDQHLHELARRGAEVRLRELVDEFKFLVSAFPNLKDSFDADELPVKFLIARGAARAAAAEPGRRKRTMSAAARKAVSARMKKYWEARKKAEK